MRDPDVIVRMSCWTVSYVPEAIHPLDAEAYSIRVEYSGHDRWAIRWLHRCLGADGRWSHEPIPSSRTDDWLAARAAVTLPRGVGGDVEWWIYNPAVRVGHLRVAVTPGEHEQIPAGCAVDDAGPSGPARRRTR